MPTDEPREEPLRLEGFAAPLRGNEHRFLAAEPVVSHGGVMRVAQGLRWTFDTLSPPVTTEDQVHVERVASGGVRITEGDVIWVQGPLFHESLDSLSPVVADSIGAIEWRVHGRWVYAVGSLTEFEELSAAVAGTCVQTIEMAIASGTMSSALLEAAWVVHRGLERIDLHERLTMQALRHWYNREFTQYSRLVDEARDRVDPNIDLDREVRRRIDFLTETRRAIAGWALSEELERRLSAFLENYESSNSIIGLSPHTADDFANADATRNVVDIQSLRVNRGA